MVRRVDRRDGGDGDVSLASQLGARHARVSAPRAGRQRARGTTARHCLAAAAFLCFDIFFLPPFGTLTIQDPLNWLVLVAFLGTSILSAQLLYRAQAEAELARERAAEIDRLAALGAETLNVAHAEEALTAIVNVIRSSLRIDDCAVYTTGAGAPAVEPLIAWVLREGTMPSNESMGRRRRASCRTRFDGSARSFARPPRTGKDGRPVSDRAKRRPPRYAGTGAHSRRARHYAALGVERAAGRRGGRPSSCRSAAPGCRAASVSHDPNTARPSKGSRADPGARRRRAGGSSRRKRIGERSRAKIRPLAHRDQRHVVRRNPEAEDLLGAMQQVAGRLNGRASHRRLSADEPLLGGSSTSRNAARS